MGVASFVLCEIALGRIDIETVFLYIYTVNHLLKSEVCPS
jgi:hypothetical protein